MEYSLQEIRELLKSGQTELALEKCRETLEEKYTSVGHWAFMGAALSSLGRSQEAFDALKRACDLYPKKAALWFNLGVAYEKAGLTSEALAQYRTAAATEPDYEPAQAALVRLEQVAHGTETLADDAEGAYCEGQPCAPTWEEQPAPVCEEPPTYAAPAFEETAQPLPPVETEKLPETLLDDEQGAYCEAQPCAPAWEEAQPIIDPSADQNLPAAEPAHAEPASGAQEEPLIFGLTRQKAYLYGGIALVALIVVILFAMLVFSRPQATEAPMPSPTMPGPMMPRPMGPKPMMPNPPVKPAPGKKSEAPANKVVYITFDGGPSQGFNSRVLPVLKKHNCPATFFVVGQYMKRDKTSLAVLVKAGHEVENHTDTHPHLSTLDDESIRRDVRAAADEIKRQTGREPTLVRPPYGDHDARVDAVIQDMGYGVSMWNVTCPDFATDDPQRVVKSLVKQVKPGSVILMHVTRSAWQALPTLLAELDKMGYSYAPLKSNPTYAANRNGAAKMAESSSHQPIL